MRIGGSGGLDTPAGAVADCKTVARARANGLDGVVLCLTWLRLLHRVANPAVPDRVLRRELQRLIVTFRRHPPIKGTWEVLGSGVVHAVRTHGRALDTVDLERLIDEVCDEKAESLDPDDQKVFRLTRQGWGSPA